jgi:hypothetical protein
MKAAYWIIHTCNNSFAYIGVNLLLSGAFPWPLELGDPNRTLYATPLVCWLLLRCGNGHRRRVQRDMNARMRLGWPLGAFTWCVTHTQLVLIALLCWGNEPDFQCNRCPDVYAAWDKWLFGFWSLNTFGCKNKMKINNARYWRQKVALVE